ncbi:NlpC/P60 family protein [Bacillus salitolerans]|uniref:NlpC/P60 family protein n=1 Tax=Bacillus salitolerans TaxID=1437434 RepID=A0ABW4LS87_9BACI
MIRRFIFPLVSLFLIFFFNNISVQAEEKKVNYDKLLPTAKQYIGVPYKYGGTTDKGFDCSGFLQAVYEQLSITLPRTAADQYQKGEKISKDDLRPGDLVFFETYKPGASHAGIYIGNDQFIHSSSSKGVSISSINDPYYWSKRYLGARRYLSFELDLGKFNDIESDHFAKEAIEELSKDHLLIGYNDSYFYPDDSISREQIAMILSVALELDLTDRKNSYNDINDDYWGLGAVNAVSKADVLKADNEGKWNPSSTLTREKLAAVLVKAFELGKANNPAQFSDVPTSHPNYDAIQRLAASGITTGFSDGTFRPNDEVTRAQFVVFLYRALELKK